jgi:hypothetical protein
MPIAVKDVLERLDREGYYVAREQLGEAPAQFILNLGRSLGELYVPSDCNPMEPVITTSPARSHRVAPFDRPEAIGWHGDFATYENRPEISIVYITRPDPRGGHYGAWRLASVERVLESLLTTIDGRSSRDLLSSETLPFTYADNEALRWFKVIENRPNGKLGIRFYLPSLHRGCIAEYGEVPSNIADALAAVERAADSVAEVVPTQEGSLLIASNWFALHDRVRQTVSRHRPNREALLCFVERCSGRNSQPGTLELRSAPAGRRNRRTARW